MPDPGRPRRAGGGGRAPRRDARARRGRTEGALPGPRGLAQARGRRAVRRAPAGHRRPRARIDCPAPRGGPGHRPRGPRRARRARAGERLGPAAGREDVGRADVERAARHHHHDGARGVRAVRHPVALRPRQPRARRLPRPADRRPHRQAARRGRAGERARPAPARRARQRRADRGRRGGRRPAHVAGLLLPDPRHRRGDRVRRQVHDRHLRAQARGAALAHARGARLRAGRGGDGRGAHDGARGHAGAVRVLRRHRGPARCRRDARARRRPR